MLLSDKTDFVDVFECCEEIGGSDAIENMTFSFACKLQVMESDCGTKDKCKQLVAQRQIAYDVSRA